MGIQPLLPSGFSLVLAPSSLYFGSCSLFWVLGSRPARQHTWHYPSVLAKFRPADHKKHSPASSAAGPKLLSTQANWGPSRGSAEITPIHQVVCHTMCPCDFSVFARRPPIQAALLATNRLVPDALGRFRRLRLHLRRLATIFLHNLTRSPGCESLRFLGSLDL